MQGVGQQLPQTSFGMDLVQASLHSQQQQQQQRFLQATMMAQQQQQHLQQQLQQQQQQQTMNPAISTSISSHVPLVLPPVRQSKKVMASTFPSFVSNGGTMALPSMYLGNNIQSTMGPPALRTGKWIPVEEQYAILLIELFEKGQIIDCENGSTLRSYLSSKLFCPPMRISKKFAGKGIGKMMYLNKLNVGITISLDQRRTNETKLKTAECNFLQAIMPGSLLMPFQATNMSQVWSVPADQRQNVTDSNQNTSSENQASNINRSNSADNQSTASSTVIVSNVANTIETTMSSQERPTELIDVPVKTDTASFIDNPTKQLQESYRNAVSVGGGGGGKVVKSQTMMNEENMSLKKHSHDIPVSTIQQLNIVQIGTTQSETRKLVAFNDTIDYNEAPTCKENDVIIDKTNPVVPNMSLTHSSSLPSRNDRLNEATPTSDPLTLFSEAYMTLTTSFTANTNMNYLMPYHIPATTSGSFDIDGTMKILSEHVYGGESTIKRKVEAVAGLTATKSVSVIEGSNGVRLLSSNINSILNPDPKYKTITGLSTDEKKNIKITSNGIVSGSNVSHLGTNNMKESVKSIVNVDLYNIDFEESDYSSCGSSCIDSDDDDDEEDEYDSADDGSAAAEGTKKRKVESKTRKAKRSKI